MVNENKNRVKWLLVSKPIESPALLVEINDALRMDLAQPIEISDAVRKAAERVAFAAYPVGFRQRRIEKNR